MITFMASFLLGCCSCEPDLYAGHDYVYRAYVESTIWDRQRPVIQPVVLPAAQFPVRPLLMPPVIRKPLALPVTEWLK